VQARRALLAFHIFYVIYFMYARIEMCNLYYTSSLPPSFLPFHKDGSPSPVMSCILCRRVSRCAARRGAAVFGKGGKEGGREDGNKGGEEDWRRQGGGEVGR